MSDAPVLSTEADVKERLGRALERGTKVNEFDALMRDGNFKKAAEVAAELGGPLPRHQIVELQERRSRR